MTQVILVDEQDEPLAYMEKLEAHQKGLLHRAFSIFIFNSKGEMLLQQRAMNKYHSAGLWANACCSHPAPGEETVLAAQRRLNEEMGFSTTLKHCFTFKYLSHYDNGLTEHEIDHVFTGIYNGAIMPNQSEVEAFAFEPLQTIKKAIEENQEKYSSWFKIAFPMMEAYLATAEPG